MRATCPECGAQAHIGTFFAEDDGKRLAMTVAGMPAELGRATIAYLGLFKPPKTALRLSRAAKIAAEVADLVATGSVCRDERAGVRRPASAGLWTLGIEQMLAQRASLSLPLESHGYLRAVVFGLADKADAAQERQREAGARAGQHLQVGTAVTAPPQETPLERQLAWIARMQEMEQFDQVQADAERVKAREKYGSNQ
ncbi:hypothetical protein [Xanthomonas sp. CFBP 8445]|uniref:hypothetical protein n=1 Tax=Xanthomonas sp. CFBP 8445 TaxID=2971236 RepID=UPI0021E0A9AE|nr:hypothetical protein [Xanthomonas sp. CFBP 8445]UYC12268.1 hypothetical protein NUG21_00490 [Xanthomonas sp. CFBP 8445]